MMVVSILQSKNAAIPPPRAGDIIQLRTICPILSQLITSTQRAMIPAPTSHPMTEWVAETGDLV